MSDHAIANAKAWLENIRELVTRLDSEDGDAVEAAREEIYQAPLSVQVRDGWRSPGKEAGGAEEYEILLSTGGPALRVVGALEGGEPDDRPCLQWQDWGVRWTEHHVSGADLSALRRFVGEFYFGDT